MAASSVVNTTTLADAAAMSPPGIVRSLEELLAAGHVYPTIYADPPWTYRNRSSRAAAINHYATLSLQDICQLPIRELATTNSHLHLWATAPLLQDALTVMRSWGFEYKSCFVWVKGFAARGQRGGTTGFGWGGPDNTSREQGSTGACVGRLGGRCQPCIRGIMPANSMTGMVCPVMMERLHGMGQGY